MDTKAQIHQDSASLSLRSAALRVQSANLIERACALRERALLVCAHSLETRMLIADACARRVEEEEETG